MDFISSKNGTKTEIELNLDRNTFLKMLRKWRKKNPKLCPHGLWRIPLGSTTETWITFRALFKLVSGHKNESVTVLNSLHSTEDIMNKIISSFIFISSYLHSFWDNALGSYEWTLSMAQWAEKQKVSFYIFVKCFVFLASDNLQFAEIVVKMEIQSMQCTR